MKKLDMSTRSRRLFFAAVSAVIATGAVGLSTSPSWADALPLGPGVFSSAVCTPVCNGSFGNTDAAGAIQDTFAFTITAASSPLLFAASATNSSTVAGQIILGFGLNLWQGIPDPAHVGDTHLQTAGPGTSSATLQETGGLSDVLGPGSYYLE